VGVERKLTAILCADVYGYSRLMGGDEEATLVTLTAHRKLIDSFIEQHHGRFVNSAGDSVLAEFASVVETVNCAVNIQTALKAENAKLPTERRMEFRIGVNLGDVMVEGDQIYGDGINVAARLESLADPGGICISGTVHEQVRDKLALGYKDSGEQTVKNIARPVHVWRVFLTGTTSHRETHWISRRYWRRGVLSLTGLAIIVGTIVLLVQHVSLKPQPTRASIPPQEKPALSLPSIPSIAVLPFTDLSGDPKQGYFSDGITDELINDLSRIPGLFVIDRNSSFSYKGKAATAKQVSRELGVHYLLEGGTRKAGNQVRITVQLVDATAGANLWTQRYDRPFQDILSLQDEIVKKIMTTLRLEVRMLQRTDIPIHQSTDNIEAYDCYLQAFEYGWNNTTSERNAKGRELLEKAIQLDPNYVDAYVLLGFSYFYDLANQYTQEPRQQVWQRVVDLAHKVVALDDTNPGAYLLLSKADLRDNNFEKAIDDAQRSISLAPNCAVCYSSLAEALLAVEQPAEAVTALEKAMRLDPRGDVYFFPLGGAYIEMGRYADAVRVLKKYIAGNPGESLVHAWLIVAYNELGREREAREEAAEVLRSSPGFSLEVMARESHPKNRALFERYLSDMRKAGLK
jgi:adenylate cyclase